MNQQLQQRLQQIARLAIAEYSAWVERNAAKEAYRDWLTNFRSETGEDFCFEVDFEQLEPEGKKDYQSIVYRKNMAQRKLGTARAATRRAIKKAGISNEPTP